MHVLVVEDQLKMASLIRRGLVEEGYTVDLAADGDEALNRAGVTRYDVIVLDVMLPGIDGVEVCRRLRERRIWAPILMLTARDGVEDRVAALGTGADDYLTKPFSFAELLARMQALAGGGADAQSPVLEVGSLRLDPRTHELWRGVHAIRLSPREFALLDTFMRRPGQVLSRLDLLEHARDCVGDEPSRDLEVCVRSLRRKIDRPFGTNSLETVHIGRYRLRRDGGE